MNRRVCGIAAALIVASCLPVRAEPREATAEEVRQLARSIPILDSSENRRFIVRGVMAESTDGYSYEVIANGPKVFRSAMLDPDTHEPLVVSNVDQVFVMDFFTGTSFAVDGARYDIMISAGERGVGLTTTHWRHAAFGPDGLLRKSRIDIRTPVLAATNDSSVEHLADGTVRLIQKIDKEKTRVVQFAPPPSRNFIFAQHNSRVGRYTSFHSVILDDAELDAANWRLPTLKEFAEQIKLEVNPANLDQGRWSFLYNLPKVLRALRKDEGALEQLQLEPVELEAMRIRYLNLSRPWGRAIEAQEIVILGPRDAWAKGPMLQGAAVDTKQIPAGQVVASVGSATGIMVLAESSRELGRAAAVQAGVGAPR